MKGSEARRLVRDLISLLGVIGVLLDIADHQFHRGGSLLRRSGLHASPVRCLRRSCEGLTARRHLAGWYNRVRLQALQQMQAYLSRRFYRGLTPCEPLN